MKVLTSGMVRLSYSWRAWFECSILCFFPNFFGGIFLFFLSSILRENFWRGGKHLHCLAAGRGINSQALRARRIFFYFTSAAQVPLLTWLASGPHSADHVCAD